MEKNSFLSRLLLVAFMSFAFAFSAKAQQYGDFTYTDYGTEITIDFYAGTGGAVTIPGTIDGKPVTSIGDSAFFFCTSLTSIKIPASVTSIGSAAFALCSNLSGITISSNVTIIGDNAFEGCAKLTSVTIPASVTSIGYSAFCNCSSLNAINVSPLNPYYSSTAGVLFNKSKDTLIQCPGGKKGSYIIPDSVTTIGSIAFGFCSKLSSVTISDKVSFIEDMAFMYCDSLININVDALNPSYSSLDGVLFNKDQTTLIQCPGGKTTCEIPDSVTRIGYDSFSGCVKLSSITVGTGITDTEIIKISSYSPGLTSIIVDELNPSCSSVDGVVFNKDKTTLILYPCGRSGSYTIPGSVTAIGRSAFRNCANLTGVTIPGGVTSIGESAFADCTKLDSITIPDSVTIIGYSAFKNCSNLASVMIGAGVTSIGDYAFSDCAKLTSVTIPDSVTSIGHNAFPGCTELTSVVIGKGVTIIKSYAFSDCAKLTSVTIPDSVTSIGEFAFSDCASLTSVVIGSGVTNIGFSAFAGCSKLTSITIPDNVTSLGRRMFFDCTSLTSVIIGNGVTSLGDLDFSGCTSLTSVTIGSGVTSIDGDVFSGCDSLTSVTIGSGVTSIEDNAFSGCTGLASITIPDSVTSIGDNAFSGCTSLTSIAIGSGVTSIGWSAFSGCTKLDSITIPGSVTSIEGYAFSGCTSLTSATIPDSVTSIENNAFSGCTSLISIAIGNGVTSIGWSVFSGCVKLNSVTIGTGMTCNGIINAFSDCTGLASINVDALNPSCSSTDGLLLSKDKKTLILFPKGKAVIFTIPEGITMIGESAFSNCTNLTSVIIPDSVTSIGDFAFYDCTSLTGITIPNHVTSLGWRAFYSCTSLTSITIPDSVTTIGIGAFEACTGLCSITLGSGITSIGDSAFSDCTKLTSVIIPDSAISIGAQAFYGCTKLASVTIGTGVASIGDNAFSDCTSLPSITIPDGVTSIGDGTFQSCTKLESVSIGAGITSIGDDMFNNCTSLISVTIPDGVTIIGAQAFYRCTRLTNVKIGAGVTSIGSSAFSGCSGLTSVVIPANTTSIGDNAFYGCARLWLAIFLGDAPDNMGTGAFDSCASNFTVYYIDGAHDFASPAWEGYPSKIMTHQVVFTAGKHGAVVGPAEQTVKHGLTSTSVLAQPDAGYHFSGWSGSYSGDENPLEIGNVDSNMIVSANFEQDTVMLMFFSDGEGEGRVTCPEMVNLDSLQLTYPDTANMDSVPTMTAIPILAIPLQGSRFICWTVMDGDAVIADPNSAKTTVTLTGEDGPLVKISAVFDTDSTTPKSLPAPPVVSASDGKYRDRIVVTWKHVPYAYSYEIYRNTTNHPPTEEELFTGTCENTIEDNTAEDGTKYYYFVRACNEIGWGKFSAGNAGYLMKPPSAPGAVTASDGKYFDKIRVSWAKVDGARSYLVFRTESMTSVPDPLSDDPIGETSALFLDDFGDDIVPLDGASVKKYYYWIAAKNSKGTTLISKSNAGCLSSRGPTAVTASNGKYSNKVVVSWKPVTGATSYDVHRYKDSRFKQLDNAFGGAGVTSAGTSLEYEDISVSYGVFYYYKVKAKYGSRYDSALSTSGACGMTKSNSSSFSAISVNAGETFHDISYMPKGSTIYFSVEVPPGTARLVARLDGTNKMSSNDCNLFAKFANCPTVSSYNAKGAEDNANEVLMVANPAPGTWYFMLYGVTDYSGVALTVNCYSVADIVLTQTPANNLPIPFSAEFSGKVIDESGTGIPNICVQVRNPITGTTTALAKTKKDGTFKYTANIAAEGEYTFDFIFGEMPGLATGTASHIVMTKKGYIETYGYFSNLWYLPTTPMEIEEKDEIVGLQNFLNIRNGWTNGVIDTTYETMWVNVNIQDIPHSLPSPYGIYLGGLFMVFHGVEGACVGNDNTATTVLSTVPLVAVGDSGDLTNLKDIGIFSAAQKASILSGNRGFVSVTAISAPDEGGEAADISLNAGEQIEVLRHIVSYSSVTDVIDVTYSGIAAKQITVILDSGRRINVVAAGFVK